MSLFENILGKGTEAVKITLVFEVVDDPTDKSEFYSYLKPIALRYFFSSDLVSVPLDVKNYYEDRGAHQVIIVPGISKQTPLAIRQWETIDPDYHSKYMYVLAEPTKEWKHLYESRQYKVQVFSGNTYNIPVSLPVSGSGSNTPSRNTALRKLLV